MLRKKSPPKPQSAAVLNPRQQPKTSPRLKSPRPRGPRRMPLRNLLPRKNPNPKRRKRRKKRSRRNPRERADRLLRLLLLRRRLPSLPKQTISRLLPDRSVNLLLLLPLMRTTLKSRLKSLLKRRRSVVVVRRLLEGFSPAVFSAFYALVSHGKWKWSDEWCYVSGGVSFPYTL